MKFWKKTGQILLCPVPLLLMLALQVLSVVVGLIYLAIVAPSTYNYFMAHYSLVLLAVQSLTLAVFGVWYFLAYGRHQSRVPLAKVFSLKDVGVYVLLGMGGYFLVSIYMALASLAAPDLIESYQKMIEESGLSELSLLSTISTLILAPLSEELIFRGITMNLAKKAFRYFWVANFVQALFFGIAHMNWIQGTYAFALGLLLGYLCHKYNSLYAGMLMHFLFNFFGTYFATFLDHLFPEESASLLVYGIFLLIGIVTVIPCLIFIQKTKGAPKKEAPYWTGQPL